ncbi:MAG: hypothetical protein M3R72_05200 [Bacteroidota bacterium]|nr:hypothetical protein [Bacteroidota bacterium]
MNVAISKHGIPIRLTEERWQHITIGHPEIADYYYEILETIEKPEIIYEGSNDAKIAVKKVQEKVSAFIVVIYKETSVTDGFVITAYFSNKEQEFKKKNIVWKQQN